MKEEEDEGRVERPRRRGMAGEGGCFPQCCHTHAVIWACRMLGSLGGAAGRGGEEAGLVGCAVRL